MIIAFQAAQTAADVDGARQPPRLQVEDLYKSGAPDAHVRLVVIRRDSDTERSPFKIDASRFLPRQQIDFIEEAGLVSDVQTLSVPGYRHVLRDTADGERPQHGAGKDVHFRNRPAERGADIDDAPVGVDGERIGCEPDLRARENLLSLGVEHVHCRRVCGDE